MPKSLLCYILFYCQLLFAWGKLGHNITAKIAEIHLSKNAEHAVHDILGNNDLVGISDWADVIRPSKRFIKLHYTSMNAAGKLLESKKNGLLFTGIKNAINTLAAKNSTKQEQEIALKLLVHLLGDAHQPLHVGNGYDAGGNLCGVNWFKRKRLVSLHKIWDVFLVKAAYAQNPWLVAESSKISPPTSNYDDVDILSYLRESRSLHKKIYPKTCTNIYAKKPGEHLSGAYVKANINIVKERLMLGGLRLAGILNKIYKNYKTDL